MHNVKLNSTLIEVTNAYVINCDCTQSKTHRDLPIKEGDIVTLRAQPVAPRDVGNIFRQDSFPHATGSRGNTRSQGTSYNASE